MLGLLDCADEAMLLPITIEALSDKGRAIGASSSKICASYPLANMSLGDAFNEKAWMKWKDLSTIQFVLPYNVSRKLAKIRIATSMEQFALYYQDSYYQSSNSSVTVDYPPKKGVFGDPVHASLFKVDGSGALLGDKLMAAFISVRKPPEAYDCSAFDHCCQITSDIGNGLTEGTCIIRKPAWKCFTAQGAPWQDVDSSVGYINYFGSLADTPMAAGNKSLLLHLTDDAEVSVPLTNSYAQHSVYDSPACRKLCASLHSAKTDLSKDANAAGCLLSSPPAFRAKAGYGPITVNGFGRVSGQKMMQQFSFQSKKVWSQLGAGSGVLNGYGNAVQKFKSLADAESHTRWRIQSGLLELSSAVPDPRTGFAVDVSELAVAWGAKRGDGSLRLQFPRVPLDGDHTVGDSDKPVKMHDVKTPGTWMGASDGPRITSSSSRFSFLYLHHADDNLKIDSSSSHYKSITLLSGNIGSAIELGTYGIGLRDNAVRQATLDGVYLHRITQGDGQDDSLGSVIGSRTCPWGINISDVTVQNLYLPSASGHNHINSLYSLGSYGAPDGSFANSTNQDRWFFCSNPWWLDSETIRTAGTAVTLAQLRFLDWKVYVRPAAKSLLYNLHKDAGTIFDGIAFYDLEGEGPSRTSSRWPQAVQIFSEPQNSSYFYTPCLADMDGESDGEKCWDSDGEILGRKSSCDRSNCNTFRRVFDASRTTFRNINFPFGV